MKKKVQLDEEEEEAALLFERVPDIVDEERFYLDRIVHFLKQRPTDPKLDAVVHFLTVRGWLELGCIIFSQYYDTAYWVAESLTELLPESESHYMPEPESRDFSSEENGGVSNAMTLRKLCVIGPSGL